MQHTEIFGIIGNPLGHSLSPRLHNWAFKQRKYAAIFKAWSLEKSQLADFVVGMRTLKLAGACVTIPYKESIIPLLDEISPRAKSIGAVNTLYWQGDKLCGENTDVDGFKLPLLKRAKPTSALILGAGGAARAVIVGLRELGIAQIRIANRNAEKAEALAQEFDIDTVSWHKREQNCASWIINTTPLGMHGSYAELSPYDFSLYNGQCQQDKLAYDLVYNPLQTKFLYDAKQAGLVVQDGLDMFVGQAIKQMQIWTNSSTDIDKTREFLLEIRK